MKEAGRSKFPVPELKLRKVRKRVSKKITQEDVSMKMKNGIALLACMAFLVVSGIGLAHAADWKPTKPITLICPFAPGSVGDTFSRPFAEVLSKHAGVKVLVENIGGGSGSIGTMAMLRKPADGYTFSYHSNTGALNTAAGSAPFGVDSVLPVANICSDFHIISVVKDSPFKTFNDLVAFAKANPGKLKIGGAQVMGNNHLFGLLIMRDFSIDASYIPYDDGASSVLGLLGKNTDCLLSTNSTAAAYAKNGDTRVLAYTLSKPTEEYPGVPTFASLGSTGLDNYISFKGMFINPKCPPEVRKWYDETFKKVCQDKAWQDFIGLQGQVDTYMDMATFSAYYKKYVTAAKELFATAR